MSISLVVVNAGTGDPSSTGMLADRTAQRIATLAEGDVSIRRIDIRDIAQDVTTALLTQHVSSALKAAHEAIAAADAVVAATPVYAAGPSGPVLGVLPGPRDRFAHRDGRSCSRRRPGLRDTRSSPTTRCAGCSGTSAR